VKFLEQGGIVRQTLLSFSRIAGRSTIPNREDVTIIHFAIIFSRAQYSVIFSMIGR